MRLDASGFFSLRKKILYGSSERIISVEQLKHSFEYGFYHIKSIRNLGKKFG